MRTRIGEPLSIAEAARDLGVSERTLQRTVTRVLGCSPIRLVQSLRVEQAEHLRLPRASTPVPGLVRTTGSCQGEEGPPPSAPVRLRHGASVHGSFRQWSPGRARATPRAWHHESQM
ncbi:helix-turn-helix domain-containing protein [Kitasatospora sp. NPDC127111]|uniref:helix-turn-helix domain-containing protein n=1 Tax=Kitasatospora sp. NPDC127111 TaxID=3345363 RepID=UPI003636A51D